MLFLVCKYRKEVFLGFDGVSEDRRAPVIAAHVLSVLEKYDCFGNLG